MGIQIKLRCISIISIFILTIQGIAFAQEKPDSLASNTQTESPGEKQINPSSWLEQTENSLILIESKLLEGYDSSFMNEDYPRLISTFELINKDFNSRGEFMRLRSLDDIKAEMIQLRNQVDIWRKRIARINTEISTEFNSLHKIKQDSIRFYIRQDSAMWGIYDEIFSQQKDLVAKIDAQCQFTLSKFVGIEKKLNLLIYNIVVRNIGGR